VSCAQHLERLSHHRREERLRADSPTSVRSAPASTFLSLALRPTSPPSWCAILEESHRRPVHPQRAPRYLPSITAGPSHQRPLHPATDPSSFHLHEHSTDTTHLLNYSGGFPDPRSDLAPSASDFNLLPPRRSPPVSPSSRQHPKWLPHLFFFPLDTLHHRILPPATRIDRCRHHPAPMGRALPCFRDGLLAQVADPP
jgi:hypothetical protein